MPQDALELVRKLYLVSELDSVDLEPPMSLDDGGRRGIGRVKIPWLRDRSGGIPWSASHNLRSRFFPQVASGFHPEAWDPSLFRNVSP